MGGFLGFGFGVVATARRQQKLARLWSLFNGTSTWSYVDGSPDAQTLTLNAGSTITLNSGVSGFMAGSYSGAGLVTVNGGGTVTFNTDNPGWSGGITIQKGTVTLAATRTQALGTGTVTVNAGGVLNLGGNTIANSIVNNGGTVNP